jgi:hypothetical protein
MPDQVIRTDQGTWMSYPGPFISTGLPFSMVT